MLKKVLLPALLLACLLLPVFAEEPVDQDYVNKLTYQRNKITVIEKRRIIDEQRNYNSTNVNMTTYSFEAYTQTLGNTSTSSLSQGEKKEVSDWYIYKGGIRELSDLEFLNLVNDPTFLDKVKANENEKSFMRSVGTLSVVTGILTMMGGAALSASSTVITAGGVVTAVGLLLHGFNLSPHHYIQPDYAQEKADEYNVALKKKLNLPLQFE